MGWGPMTRTLAHYHRLEQIGEGTYGQVYRAKSVDTGRIVALKKIRVHHGGYWGMPPTVLREIKILKRLRHPRLVEMVEVVSSKGVEYLEENDPPPEEQQHKRNSKKDRIVDAREGYKGNLYLVLEYVSHDLTGLMDVAFRFTEVQVKCIFRQLLEALEYMHEHKYVHRDIKSSNILIDSYFRVKLADFGLARCIEPPILDTFSDRGSHLELTNKVITLWYRPPEILLGATRYSFPVDVWSAGCILAELLLGRPLFTGKTEMDQLQLIFDLLGTPTPESWEGLNDLKLLRTGEVTIDKQRSPRLRDKYGHKISGPALNLLEKLLELDPQKRLSASRALTSRYFLSEPKAPDHPEDLGMLKLGEGGGHFHEFQTKKKRREAKVTAKRASDVARARGLSEKEAEAEYDLVYRGCMKKVAEEGNAALLTQETKKEEQFTPPKKVEVHESSREKLGRREAREKEPVKKELQEEVVARHRREGHDRTDKPDRKDENKNQPDRKRQRGEDDSDRKRSRRRAEAEREDHGDKARGRDSKGYQKKDVELHGESETAFVDHSAELFDHREKSDEKYGERDRDKNGSTKSERRTERDRKRSDKEDRKRTRDHRRSSRDSESSREHRHRSSRRDHSSSPRRDREERSDERDRHHRSSRAKDAKDDRHRKGSRDRSGRSRDRSLIPDEREQKRSGRSGAGREVEGGERGDWDRGMNPLGPRGPEDRHTPRDFRGDYHHGPPPPIRRGPPDGPRRSEWSGPPFPGQYGTRDSFGPAARGPPPPRHRDERDRPRGVPDHRRRDPGRNRPGR